MNLVVWRQFKTHYIKKYILFLWSYLNDVDSHEMKTVIIIFLYLINVTYGAGHASHFAMLTRGVSLTVASSLVLFGDVKSKN